MVCQWEAWVQYDHNAVVEYEGHLYKIVQPHQSEPNWQPPVVPALWSRVPEECHHEYRSGDQGNQQQYQNQNQGFVDQSSGGGNYGQQNMPQPGGWGHEEKQNNYDHQSGGGGGENKEESWLDDAKKHKLEIGGGILGALAIGGGVYAYISTRAVKLKKRKSRRG